MTKRNKILIVDSDLDTLSKVYLALVHRNFKVEASDKQEEIAERIKRLKPELIIMGSQEYLLLQPTLKIPGIVLMNKDEKDGVSLDDAFIAVDKPVHIDELMRAIESIVI
jgi:DNA-binding response OmpR family regulator